MPCIGRKYFVTTCLFVAAATAIATTACSSGNDSEPASTFGGYGGFGPAGAPGWAGFIGTGGAVVGTGGAQVGTGAVPASAGGVPVGSAGVFGAGGIGAGGINSGTGGSLPGFGGAGGDNGAGGTAGIGPVGTGGAAAAGAGGTGGSPGATLPPTSDYAQRGPFKTTTTPNTGPSNGYTIFRPDPLGENGFVHPLIIFGPGILTTASSYSNFLGHLASHGFVTICVNSMSGGPNAPANLQAMQSGLDWLIAQNGAPGIFQGKLDVNRAVGMGYSIGATGSTQLSSHKAIVTTVSIHGHNTSGDPHGPVLLLTGTNDVIDDNRTTLSTLVEAPAILAALPIGHLNVLTELAMSAAISANTRYVAPITAWLRYWVNGDQDAKRFFWGPNCQMCSSPWITPETNALWDAQQL